MARPSFYDGWPIRRNRRAGSFLSPRFVFSPNTWRHPNRERYEEFRKANALPLARDVALAFSKADRPMTDAKLNALLAQHPGNPAEMLSMLNAKGFVWQDDNDHWTPGTPSLME